MCTICTNSYSGYSTSILRIRIIQLFQKEKRKKQKTLCSKIERKFQVYCWYIISWCLFNFMCHFLSNRAFNQKFLSAWSNEVHHSWWKEKINERKEIKGSKLKNCIKQIWVYRYVKSRYLEKYHFLKKNALNTNFDLNWPIQQPCEMVLIILCFF